ncbi:MAG: hypothetical protein KGJ54_09880 [Betaproteobacteria bacterium]|jgi:hypothetical protein|nr:hypothetical protein [Betaproteobacteria bacterium]
MNRSMSLMFAAVLLAMTAGCSQKPQTLTQTGAPPSQDPWMGANPAFTEKDWKVGDKASWQREINRRAQNQNEYVRMR